jgi:UDP:flavonoid glycosyltransferase YjiC (YdhE family)
MSGAGLVAADMLGLPTAVLVHVLYQPFACYWGDLPVDVAGCRGALGLAPLEPAGILGQLSRAAKVLVAVPRGFDYPDAPPRANTHYVGPIQQPQIPTPPELPWDADEDRPRVLVSLSSTYQHQEQAVVLIVEALGQLPVNALLTLGQVLRTSEICSPPNVAVRDFVPHPSVLPQVSVVVCHGGLSTIMVSRAHGVPLVCIPQGREQGLNADRVSACGAGLNLSSDATPHR